jgi:hypothetical protein
MSALPPKADIDKRLLLVRFVLIADGMKEAASVGGLFKFKPTNFKLIRF